MENFSWKPQYVPYSERQARNQRAYLIGAVVGILFLIMRFIFHSDESYNYFLGFIGAGIVVTSIIGYMIFALFVKKYPVEISVSNDIVKIEYNLKDEPQPAILFPLDKLLLKLEWKYYYFAKPLWEGDQNISHYIGPGKHYRRVLKFIYKTPENFWGSKTLFTVAYYPTWNETLMMDIFKKINELQGHTVIIDGYDKGLKTKN